MNARLRIALLVTAGAVTGLASSATLRTIDVTRKHGVYSLHADTFLAATPEAIYEVLLDYEHFNRISRIYKEHRYLDPAPDGTPMIYTRMEGCLLFYCKSMRRVERVQTVEPAFIRTDALPEQSDFKKSYSEWQLEPEPGGTRMIYTLVMEPDFFVPPVIGPWLLQRTLETGGSRTIQRIERLAQAVEQDANAG